MVYRKFSSKKLDFLTKVRTKNWIFFEISIFSNLIENFAKFGSNFAKIIEIFVWEPNFRIAYRKLEHKNLEIQVRPFHKLSGQYVTRRRLVHEVDWTGLTSEYVRLKYKYFLLECLLCIESKRFPGRCSSCPSCSLLSLRLGDRCHL